MKTLALAIVAVCSASSAVVAADKDEIYGAAIVQWVQVSCKNADELPDRIGAMALGTITQASKEELKEARQRVRETVLGTAESQDLTMEEKTEIICTFLIERAKQQ